MEPIVRLDSETGERELTIMRWGLVPFRTLLANSVTEPIGRVVQTSRCVLQPKAYYPRSPPAAAN
jgi:hypothetical protein